MTRDDEGLVGGDPQARGARVLGACACARSAEDERQGDRQQERAHDGQYGEAAWGRLTPAPRMTYGCPRA